MQHENALLTSQLDPPHEYVPLLQINGDHSETIQDAAHEDLTKLICVIYKVNFLSNFLSWLKIRNIILYEGQQ